VSIEREGTVERKTVAAGSKSERDAVVLTTPEGQLVLRRRGGHPFADPELDALVGKRIRAHGDEHGQTMVMESWEEV
jgi:hypothetical protein